MILTDLNGYCMQEILKKLSCEDLARTCMVNKELHSASSDEMLWKAHCLDFVSHAWEAAGMLLQEQENSDTYKSFFLHIMKVLKHESAENVPFNVPFLSKINDLKWTLLRHKLRYFLKEFLDEKCINIVETLALPLNGKNSQDIAEELIANSKKTVLLYTPPHNVSTCTGGMSFLGPYHESMYWKFEKKTMESVLRMDGLALRQQKTLLAYFLRSYLKNTAKNILSKEGVSVEKIRGILNSIWCSINNDLLETGVEDMTAYEYIISLVTKTKEAVSRILENENLGEESEVMQSPVGYVDHVWEKFALLNMNVDIDTLETFYRLYICIESSAIYKQIYSHLCENINYNIRNIYTPEIWKFTIAYYMPQTENKLNYGTIMLQKYDDIAIMGFGDYEIVKVVLERQRFRPQR